MGKADPLDTGITAIARIGFQTALDFLGLGLCLKVFKMKRTLSVLISAGGITRISASPSLIGKRKSTQV